MDFRINLLFLSFISDGVILERSLNPLIIPPKKKILLKR